MLLFYLCDHSTNTVIWGDLPEGEVNLPAPPEFETRAMSTANMRNQGGTTVLRVRTSVIHIGKSSYFHLTQTVGIEHPLELSIFCHARRNPKTFVFAVSVVFECAIENVCNLTHAGIIVKIRIGQCFCGETRAAAQNQTIIIAQLYSAVRSSKRIDPDVRIEIIESPDRPYQRLRGDSVLEDRLIKRKFELKNCAGFNTFSAEVYLMSSPVDIGINFPCQHH